jgi:hypothetical protein
MRGVTSRPGHGGSAPAEATRPGAPKASARLHVFLDASVSRDDLTDAAARIIADIAHHLPEGTVLPKLVSVSQLGRSLLLEGEPEALALAAALPHVVDTAGTDLQDVMPKPTSRRMAG